MRIANPGQVFKSTKPAEHKAIAEANETNRSAVIEAMEAYAKSLIPGTTPWAYQNDTGAVAMTGLSVPYELRNIELPAGLRWDTKAKAGNRVLAPAKKTDEGKAIVKAMAALVHKPQSLGAVSDVRVITNGTSQWFSAGVVEILGGDVYAEYHHPLETTQHGGRPSDYDAVAADPGWTPVPLSEFYAAREAAEKASV